MEPFEQILVELDSGTWSKFSRVVIGLGTVPVFRALSGGDDNTWMFIMLFVGLLVALRVVPAVLRRVVPFSAKAKAIWADRRNIAKQHDSYQWQKLFWIGLGLTPYALLGGGQGNGERVVMLICLIGGGAGLMLWHRSRTAIPAPQ
jgi:hypothetical protein